MSFKESLRAFISDNFLDNSGSVELSDDEPLIRRGIIDSMAILQLLHFIEEETGIRVPDREVQLENFQSIASVEQLVRRLSSKAKAHP